jgi:hypothetical protein
MLDTFFRGNKEEAETFILQAGLDTGTLATFKGSSAGSGIYTPVIEIIGLIFHEGDERGDDKGQAAKVHCRELVTERFSAAGSHDGKHVMSFKDRTDDLLLVRQETRAAPVFL